MKNILYFLSCCVLLVTLSGVPEVLIAQKGIRAEGTSQVRVESFVTKDQARELAEELAMINAIESEFGSYVEGGADMHLKNGRVDFDIIGETRVKGEWVRTLDISFDEETVTEKGEYGKEQVTWITCNIVGEIRECEARANLEVLTLNGPSKAFRETSFLDGEQMYLYFKSPVDGYLSVFLDDGYTAFRIFPYASMGMLSAVEVKGDKDYILFSRDDSYSFDEDYIRDIAKLTTDEDIEYNNIYAVFSERKAFVKPPMQDIQKLDDGYYLPRSLPLKKFKEWLGDCRAVMPDFQAKKIKISIQGE